MKGRRKKKIKVEKQKKKKKKKEKGKKEKKWNRMKGRKNNGGKVSSNCKQC